MDELERINGNLERAGAKDACLACGGTELIIDPSASGTALMAIVDGEIDFGRAIAAVPVICARCGFIRLHSTLHLFKDDETDASG